MMQDRAHDLWADVRFFLAQGVVAHHLVGIVATQFRLEDLVLVDGLLQGVFGKMQVITAALFKAQVVAGG